MTTQRYFNSHERLAIYAAERGLCAICGTTLPPGFHGDHIAPACHGGPTDVTNAQGLCPRCNAVKGASTDSNAPTLPNTSLALPPWTTPLRAWQEKGYAEWRRLRAEGRRDVLVTATPGSGKSLLAARIMHEEISSVRADRIVIVVPSQVLKRQWAGVAQSVGLRLAASWGNDAVVLPPDAHGIVTTFAQVARLPEALRIQCARHKVFVCLDELHHAGQGLAWGDGIGEAFEHAEARLCLSGTAWRGDAASIPFVTYDGDGNSIADVGYGYAEALADRIVREAYFFSQKGQVRWLDSEGEHEATFEDELHLGRMSRRLRAALDVNGDWLPTVMRQAATALEGVRQTHARAKGLVVCMDGSHAHAVADMAARITGERPIVALSNDPEAAQSLATFRTGGARWLVVVRMAGEGFDCPDLRVCLWATNVMTELSFRQIVGRTIRMVPGLEYQDAQIFLPADRRLLAMARSILAERAQALGGPQQDREAGIQGSGTGSQRALFVALHSKATEGTVVSGGSVIPPEALRRAEAFRVGKPALAHLPSHFIAAIFSHLEPHQWPEAGTVAPTAGNGIGPDQDVEETDTVEDYDDLRKQKRRICSRLAAAVARASDVAVEVIHRECHQRLGVRQGEASLDDLERKAVLLIARLRHLHER